MRKLINRAVAEQMRAHHGVISARMCLAAGMTRREISGCLESGEWESVHRGVYRIAGLPTTAEAALVAACLAAGPGAVASHRSAAWLWGLRREAPRPAVVSVPHGRDPRAPGFQVHRMRDLDPCRVRTRHGIPCTDPLRTIVDVAAESSGDELDDLVDRAMAARLVNAAGLTAELARTARSGRSGVGALRAALKRRGLVGAPGPSVLESRLIRLFNKAGIVPIGIEVVMHLDGEVGLSTGGQMWGAYRLDTLIAPRLAVEVDGFRYHHSPEQKTNDERRRNQLRLGGMFLLVYTWWDVVHDPGRVITEVRSALATL